MSAASVTARVANGSRARSARVAMVVEGMAVRMVRSKRRVVPAGPPWDLGVSRLRSVGSDSLVWKVGGFRMGKPGFVES